MYRKIAFYGNILCCQWEDSAIHLISSDDLQVKAVDRLCDLYDFVPLASGYAVARKDAPLQLRTINGTTVATYKKKKQEEAIFTPLALAASPDAVLLAAGDAAGKLCCFDVETTQEAFTANCSGAISCIDFAFTCCPITGQYSRSNLISLHDCRTEEIALQLANPAPGNGIAQIRRLGEHHLLAANRKDNWLYCWDLRAAGICCQLPRQAANSWQKCLFDLFYWKEAVCVAAGNELGLLSFFSLLTGCEISLAQQVGSTPIGCVAAHGNGLPGFDFYCATDEAIAKQAVTFI